MKILAREKFAPIVLALGDSVSFKVRYVDRKGKNTDLFHYEMPAEATTYDIGLVVKLSNREAKKLGLSSGIGLIVGKDGEL